VFDDRTSGQPMEHFGLGRFHPRAFSGRENDDVQVAGH
jgi:hypothetical protein